MNIDEINIGDVFIGTDKVGSFENEYAKLKGTVTDKTSNSVEILIQAVKADGVTASQWLRIGDFIKQFRLA